MTSSAPVRTEPLRLSVFESISACWELCVLSVGRLCQAGRLIVVAFLFALPVAFALLARYYDANVQSDEIEFALVFMFIPHALIPLAALVFAAGMVQDEVEEQTLTYLLVRPIPRWFIYLGKLLATVAVSALLVNLFLAATLAVTYWGSENFWGEVMPGRFLRAAGALDLALLAYCSLFGCMGLIVKRTLVLGVAYILIFEGLIANIPFLVREATVMYYFRLLSMRWLELPAPEWSIKLSESYEALTCVLVLCGTSLVATVLAMVVFSTREFRLKTPEGS
ncbi:MAG TPA: ABC transporter permease subunit [Isosphaeraceae bacterium]|jgi:ABC-2 type transport system permease protein|nr:ABC transporter permease subunit [Isosphaeraceae bacterium]